MRVLALILVCLFLSWPAGSRAYVSVGLFADPVSLACAIADNGPRVLPVYVVVQSFTPGVMAIEFRAPIPSCLQGATFVSDTQVFPVTLGDSQTGISIGLGSCRSGAVHVLTMNLQVQGLTEGCCQYPILPHPNSSTGQIEVLDCGENLVTGFPLPSFVTPDGDWWPPVVDTPWPPDGQTGMFPDTKLSWQVHYCSCGLGETWNDVYFGTTPDPPLVAQGASNPYDPGPLQLKTTYYWRIRAVDSDATPKATMGPLWTFSTGGVPVESKTWGLIKKLYGD